MEFICRLYVENKRLSECVGKRVYTDGGDFFGTVDGINLVDNNATSTSEVLVSLIESMDKKLINEDVATLLFSRNYFRHGSFSKF